MTARLIVAGVVVAVLVAAAVQRDDGEDYRNEGSEQ